MISNTSIVSRRWPKGHVKVTPKPADYTFIAKLTPSDIELFQTARQKAAKKLGGNPSNPMFLEELMRAYVSSPQERQKRSRHARSGSEASSGDAG